MAVIIGSARVDERGKYKDGQAGSQIAKEISKQNWYLHSKGWVLIRPKDSKKAEKIAKNMEYACDSKYVGYDQNQNQTLYNAVKSLDFDISKLKTMCETDCARLVRVCVLYAGIECDDFYTGTLKNVLEKTGEFEIYTSDKYCKSSALLKRGDLLCTRTKGHVVVVLSDGAKIEKATSDTTAGKKAYTGTFPALPPRGYYKEGDGIKTLTNYPTQLKRLQKFLNWCIGAGLEVDGQFGSLTEKAVIEFQETYGLKVTGRFGKDDLKKAKTIKK